jgi:para-nitrobenzyl esterase
VRDCLVYGPACPQGTGRHPALQQFFFEYNPGIQDEDCLHLNVWTPGIDDKRRRPVMVWLHGGGFAAGSSFELPSYDGRNLAARGDVVVVSLNHRLGAHGFLHLAEYGNRYTDSTNAGMLDIVAALEWVRDNVSRFGGDPGNVTVFGQSGGGAKVNFLLAMPSARGLFHKAIAQSPTPSPANARSLAFSVAHTDALIAALGLTRTTISAIHRVPSRQLSDLFMVSYFRLRNERDMRTTWNRLSDADVATIVGSPPAAVTEALAAAIQRRYGSGAAQAMAEVRRFENRIFTDDIGPVADGRVVPEAPFAVTAPALSAGIPVILGHTLNEGGGLYFFSPERESWTDADMRAYLTGLPIPVPATVVETLRQAYPAAAPVEIAAHATTGLRYSMATVAQASLKEALGSAPVYVYTFAWQTAMLDGRPRAFHRSEIPFVFDNTDRCANQTGGTDEARGLAARVADAWVAFARTGNPNHPGLPDWPTFTSKRVPIMFFDDRCAVRDDHDRDARRAFAAANPG